MVTNLSTKRLLKDILSIPMLALLLITIVLLNRASEGGYTLPLILLGFYLLIILLRFLYFFRRELIIGEEHLNLSKGSSRIPIKQIHLAKIERVDIRYKSLERSLGFGTILIELADRRVVAFDYVAGVYDFAYALTEAIRIYKQQTLKY